jgi:hypothetical protein
MATYSEERERDLMDRVVALELAVGLLAQLALTSSGRTKAQADVKHQSPPMVPAGPNVGDERQILANGREYARLLLGARPS